LDQDQVIEEAIIKVQRRLRGLLARKYVDDLRQEEMIFLGMVRKPKPLTNNWVDPVE
jgi:hypothetical protein